MLPWIFANAIEKIAPQENAVVDVFLDMFKKPKIVPAVFFIAVTNPLDQNLSMKENMLKIKVDDRMLPTIMFPGFMAKACSCFIKPLGRSNSSSIQVIINGS